MAARKLGARRWVFGAAGLLLKGAFIRKDNLHGIDPALLGSRYSC